MHTITYSSVEELQIYHRGGGGMACDKDRSEGSGRKRRARVRSMLLELTAEVGRSEAPGGGRVKTPRKTYASAVAFPQAPPPPPQMLGFIFPSFRTATQRSYKQHRRVVEPAITVSTYVQLAGVDSRYQCHLGMAPLGMP